MHQGLLDFFEDYGVVGSQPRHQDPFGNSFCSQEYLPDFLQRHFFFLFLFLFAFRTRDLSHA